jgi:hypothetical protein
MALVLKPKAVTLVTGGYVADAQKLTESLKRIAAAAMLRDPKVKDWIKIDAGEYRSVHFHTVSLPIPANTSHRERLVAMVGETMNTAVGVGPQCVYLAMGRDPVAMIRRVMDQAAAMSGKETPAFETTVALGEISRFIAATGKNDRIRSLAEIAAAGLEPSADRDHVAVSVRAIPRGVQCRLELEEGPLHWIGRIGSVLNQDNQDKKPESHKK